MLNHTHEVGARSWVASANDANTDFPIQNLPFGVMRRRGTQESFRGAVAIGSQLIDLASLSQAGVLSGDAGDAVGRCTAPTLNDLMGMGPKFWSALRAELFARLRHDAPSRTTLEPHLISQSEVEHAVPAHIGDYTDFYASIHHATRVGALFRPDNPLLPNYRWVPIGYHGRSSSIGISGERIVRPRGQRAPSAEAGDLAPSVGQSERLDYEVELGIFVGGGNTRFQPIAMQDAESCAFGLCLLNDWSARDFQAWESQPLGPFLAKNFATTLSPWIVTLEALAPFRLPFARATGEPQPLAYLDSPSNRAHGAFDIQLEASITTARMRAHGEPAQRLSLASFRHSYWTVAQLIAHHTVNGCNLRPGDLLGSGTQSGPELAEAGSLLELTAGGKHPIQVGTETRAFLHDGDCVTLRAWCERDGAVRIGFGAAEGLIEPAQRT